MKMEKRLQNIEGERVGYTLPGSGPAKDDAVDEDKESVRSRESNAGAGVGAGLHRRPTAPVPLTGHGAQLSGQGERQTVVSRRASESWLRRQRWEEHAAHGWRPEEAHS